jgi:hypothetical protein
MNEDEARINLYWKARDLLNEYINNGFESKEDILLELENDLEDE